MGGRVLRWSLFAAGASVALMVLSVLLATAPDGLRAQSQAREQILRQSVGAIKRRLDAGILERQLTLLSLAKTSLERSQLEDLRLSDPAYAWIGLTDPDGKVLAATGGLLDGVDVSTRPWFVGARGGPFTADVHDAVLLANLLDTSRREPPRFIDIAVPVTRNGEFAGVLGAHLYSDWLEQVSETAAAQIREVSGEVMVLSQDGTVQVGPMHLRGRRVAIDHAMGKVTWPEARPYQWHAEVGGSRSSGARWTVLARAPAPTGPSSLELIWKSWRNATS